MEEIQFLTSEHIYIMHRMAIDQFGGFDGEYDYTDGKIESILAQQYPIFGFDKYPNIYQKAAMLLYFFAKSQCFRDGNKRVAIQSAIVFLTINGLNDNLNDLEGYQKTMEIAESRISEMLRDQYIDNISQWLMRKFD